MSIFDFISKKIKPTQTEQTTKNAAPKPSFWSQFKKLLVGKTPINETTLDQFEELLLAADVGVPTTIKILQKIEETITKQTDIDIQSLENTLRTEILKLISLPSQQTTNNPETKPHVILVVGVNGVGKTTTIGKLAAYYKGQGKKVILGAADTFRAAAIQQLKHWSNLSQTEIVAPPHTTDPAAVAYETVQKAINIQADIAIIDTAGRLHNKLQLMQELAKIRRSITKKIPSAPHEVLLVLDATTGQNAFAQTKAFTEATAVNGLIMTKLDGTAKGGIIIGIVNQFKIPLKYIGTGEKISDLSTFNEKKFVEQLFNA